MTWLAVAVGAVLGAPLRDLIHRAVAKRTERAGARPFPWGLLVVNGAGSAAAGVVLASTTGDLRILLITGFCATFTTFSGFVWEADRLRPAARASFWWAVLVMPGVCITAFMVAWRVTETLV